MYACQAIAAGEEVLISYLGETPSKSSTELMKDYGFMMPGNLNDGIQFEAGDGEWCCKTCRSSCCWLRAWMLLLLVTRCKGWGLLPSYRPDILHRCFRLG
jgi:hypothetical protein